MLCLSCRQQPHEAKDCKYPQSCTCQHRTGAVVPETLKKQPKAEPAPV